MKLGEKKSITVNAELVRVVTDKRSSRYLDRLSWTSSRSKTKKHEVFMLDGCGHIFTGETLQHMERAS